MTLIDTYAVFGHPINHSKSPRIHQLFAEQTGQTLSYTAQDVTADRFESDVALFFNQGGKGLNCTVPLKELAWRYADHLSDRARLSQAVNTLALETDGRIFGENTDGIGLVKDLTINHQISLTGSRILILGAGGATRGILPSLFEQRPEQITIANRTHTKAEQLAGEFGHLGTVFTYKFSELAQQRFDLIINATSASLTDQLPPLPGRLLAENGSCYDLAYSHQATSFVTWGRSQQAYKSIDGLGMLVEQAAEAFKLWRGILPETRAIIRLLNSERQQVDNTSQH